MLTFSWDDEELPSDEPVYYGDGSGNEQYRTRNVCGSDYEPAPPTWTVGTIGIRIVFSFPQCGVHYVVDPIEESRFCFVLNALVTVRYIRG